MRLRRAIVLCALLLAPCLARGESDDYRWQRVGDRFNATTPPLQALDLPSGGGDVHLGVWGGADFLRQDLARWSLIRPPSTGAVVLGSGTVGLGPRLFARLGGGYSTGVTASSGLLQLGYQVLRGEADNASLSFALGAATMRYDGYWSVAPWLSGDWTLELTRDEMKTGRIWRSMLEIVLDLGFVAYDSAPTGDVGFIPLRLGAGWLNTWEWMRMRVYFDGARNGNFRLLGALEMRLSPSGDAVPKYEDPEQPQADHQPTATTGVATP